MKSLLKMLIILVALNVTTFPATQKASAQVSVSFQLFYDQLSPYGTWVMNPNYGYVWLPSAGPGFYPYQTSGYWAYTDFGWTWVSNYQWGWAPFHYGRWYFDPVYGWIWVPGNVWAPAWVSWCSSPGYYGWVPIEPGYDFDDCVHGRYHPPADHWVFLPDHYIGRQDIDRYYGPRTENKQRIENSTVVNRTYVDNSTHITYISGPDKNDVQRRTGKEIKPVTLRSSDQPQTSMKNGELNLYRPQVERDNINAVKPAPKKVEQINDVKPINERSDYQQHEVPANKNKQPQQAPKHATPQQENQPRQNTPPKSDEHQSQPQPKTQGSFESQTWAYQNESRASGNDRSQMTHTNSQVNNSREFQQVQQHSTKAVTGTNGAKKKADISSTPKATKRGKTE